MKHAARLLLTALAAGAWDAEEKPKSWIDNVDIEAEYKLIQQKKSKLARSKRNTVIRLYHGRTKNE